MQEVVQELAPAVWKTVFRTATGYFGVRSFSARERDMVVVLSGMYTPCLLRPVEGGYRFVSAVYVEGVMKGEFWRKGTKDEEFVLV